MPEGHVIHRLADALTDSFAGEPVAVTSPQGRFAVEAARLDGSVLVGSEAVGKHLFIAFDVPEPALVHIHLGLIGRLNIGPGEPSAGQIRLRITDGATTANLHGPQWCRAVTHAEHRDVLAASGPDPLRPDVQPVVDEEAGADVVEKVRRRLQHFIDRRVATHFEPLAKLQADETLTGLARGFAFRLIEAMGAA